jgi:hypothetical protein
VLFALSKRAVPSAESERHLTALDGEAEQLPPRGTAADHWCKHARSWLACATTDVKSQANAGRARQAEGERYLAALDGDAEELRATWHNEAATLGLEQLDERGQVVELAEAADVDLVKAALVMRQDERVSLLKRDAACLLRVPAPALLLHLCVCARGGAASCFPALVPISHLAEEAIRF